MIVIMIIVIISIITVYQCCCADLPNRPITNLALDLKLAVVDDGAVHAFHRGQSVKTQLALGAPHELASSGHSWG